MRELQTEATHKAELAAAWQVRAEHLAQELDDARRFIEAEWADARPWWRRWLWALAPCLAMSLVLV